MKFTSETGFWVLLTPACYQRDTRLFSACSKFSPTIYSSLFLPDPGLLAGKMFLKIRLAARTFLSGCLDVKAAASFYQKAFGFEKRGIMNGPDGKPVHAELTIRGITIMLGPEMPQLNISWTKISTEMAVC